MGDQHLFKHSVPIYQASRIIRHPSTHDVRLTPSDKIHNMIMQAAEDEYQRLSAKKMAKKELETMKAEKDKEASLGRMAPVPAALFLKAESDDKLPKLGIPALDRSLESLTSHPEAKSIPSAQTMLSLTHIGETTPPLPHQEEELIQRPSFLLPVTPVLQKQQIKVTKPKAGIRKATKKPARKVTPKKGKKTKVGPAPSPKKPTPARPAKPIKSPKAVKIVKIISKTKTVPVHATKTESIVTDPRAPSVAHELFGSKAAEAEIIDIYEDNQKRDSWLNTTWMDEMKKKLQQHALGAETTKGEPKSLAGKNLDSTPSPTDQRQEASYHPYAHRKLSKGLSNCGALAMIIKALLASNALRMPEVVEYIGHYNAVVPLILMLSWISIAFHLYLCCRHTICKTLRIPYLPYGDAMGEAVWRGPLPMRKMSRWLPVFIDTVVVYHQVIVLIKYSVFFCQYAILTFDPLKKGIYYSVYAIPFVLIAVAILCIRSMTKFVYVAAIGDFLACLHYSIILFQLIGNLSEEQGGDPDLKMRPFVSHVFFVGHMLSVTDIVVTILVVEENMKHPRMLKGYSGLLNMALIFSGLWYIVISFFSVRQFGGSKHGKYLAHLELNQWMYVLLFLIYAIVLAGAYGVQSFYPMKVLWLACLDTKIRDSENKLAWEYLVRTSYAMLPFMVMVFPKPIFYVIMLLGYISGPFLMLCCPVFAHFCVNWNNRQSIPGRLKLFADVFLLLFSFCAMAFVAMWHVNMFSIV